MPTDDPAKRVRAHLLDEHRPLLAAVRDTADEIASRWESDTTTDRDVIASGLERELGRQGILERFPAVITDAVAAAGFELHAQPVPSPPYVAITSTGPVLRSTVSDGRIVIALRVFEVRRNPARYGRRPGGLNDILDVAFVQSD